MAGVRGARPASCDQWYNLFMPTEIACCRICANSVLLPVLNLGPLALTGVFPRTADELVERAPLELVRCSRTENVDACGLVQLRHSFEPTKMYGGNYGYRSGLNVSMVEHLRKLADTAKQIGTLAPGDLVLDIGSNDGTLLSAFTDRDAELVGMDPSAGKFHEYYPASALAISDFFSASAFRARFGSRKARIVTSIAMFYDLESPMDFVRQVKEVLADDGIWVLEQSYLPTMLAKTAYDTICHEHLEYYALRQILWMTCRSGLKIIDVELNDVNGGSFRVIAAHSESPYADRSGLVREILKSEDSLGLDGARLYEAFSGRVHEHKEQVRTCLQRLRREGKRVIGYGASTKGNVLLQYCGIDASDLECIAEVNLDKFGCFTPGTRIPIVSEQEARSRRPDVFFVLPWHFRQTTISREAAFLRSGGALLFPLPTLEIL